MGDEPPIPPRTHESQDHDPGPFEHYPFNAEQQRHVDLMRQVAREVTSRMRDNFVLKGGTALLLGLRPAALLGQPGLRRPKTWHRPDPSDPHGYRSRFTEC